MWKLGIQEIILKVLLLHVHVTEQEVCLGEYWMNIDYLEDSSKKSFQMLTIKMFINIFVFWFVTFSPQQVTGLDGKIKTTFNINFG